MRRTLSLLMLALAATACGTHVPKQARMGSFDPTSVRPQVFQFVVHEQANSFTIVESMPSAHTSVVGLPPSIRVRVLYGTHVLEDRVYSSSTLQPTNWHRPRASALFQASPTGGFSAGPGPYVLELTALKAAPSNSGSLEVFQHWVGYVRIFL